jgi:hypothetical protein
MNCESKRTVLFPSPRKGEVEVSFLAPHSAVILRSRALARRLEGSPLALVAYPSRLAEDGEHLRMTVVKRFKNLDSYRGAP